MSVNDFDIAAITNEVTNFQKQGLFAAQDLTNVGRGTAGLVFQNPFYASPAFYRFEIYKIAKKRLFGKKVFWVIQSLTSEGLDGPFEKRGCIARKRLVSALTEAHKDAKYEFMSIVDMDLAIGAMTE